MSQLNSIIDQINERVSLHDVVGRVVKLQRRGSEFIGLCPFHNEKTPSFHVVERKSFYHCFGCGANGGLLQWFMNYERMQFKEALQHCANLAGVDLPVFKPQNPELAAKQANDHEIALKIYQTTNEFYVKKLYSPDGKPALDYLLGRGLNHDIIQEFSLGFSGVDGHEYMQFMAKQANVTPAKLVELGLANQFDDRSLAFWRNRIMFPIHDRNGMVIAFGGRFMGDHNAHNTGKYVNSKESILFHKGAQLYNIHRMRRALKGENQLLVVEGYMDAIALASKGIHSVVAPLGTAITADQLGILWKHHDIITLCLDGDNAGKKAALRALHLAMPLITPQKQIKILTIPGGDDPDSFVQKKPVSAFTQLVKNADGVFEYFTNHLFATHPTTTPEGRAQCTDEFTKTIETIKNPSLKREYMRSFWQKNWQFEQKNKKQNNNERKTLVKLSHSRANNIVAFCALKREFYQEFMEFQFTIPPICQKFIQYLGQFAHNHDEWNRQMAEEWFINEQYGETWQAIFNQKLRLFHPEIWQDDENSWFESFHDMINMEMQDYFKIDALKSNEDFNNKAPDDQKKLLNNLERENANLYERTIGHARD